MVDMEDNTESVKSSSVVEMLSVGDKQAASSQHMSGKTNAVNVSRTSSASARGGDLQAAAGRAPAIATTSVQQSAASIMASKSKSPATSSPAMTTAVSVTAVTSSIPPMVPSAKKSKSHSTAKSSVRVLGEAHASTVSSAGSVPPTATTGSTDGNEQAPADAQDDNPHKLLHAVRSTSLPYPLPVPTYSQAVQAARASGNILSERATIIRETVKFFLYHKYWWTSDDYDRIAELVVNEFPELRDPFTWPSQPCYSKVRLDLSMCARNIRRIAKNQEKRRGSPGRHSIESPDVTSKPSLPAASKAGKGGGKSGSSGRRASAQISRSPTMVPQSPSGQMLPHTAHTAHTTLATSTPLLDQKQLGTLSYLMTSAGSMASTPSPVPTVLPPVAHFLGHASSHSQGPGGIVFPSLVPATAAVTTASTVVSTSASQVSAAASRELNSFSGLPVSQWSTKGSDNTMKSIAAISSACHPDTQLPDPLPVPPYSDKRRVRTDLSQTARNIRRREVMLKRRDSRSPEERFAAVGTVTTLSTPSQQQPTTNFCNELLAAASIIESRTAAMQHKDSGAQRLAISKDDGPDVGVSVCADTPKASQPISLSKTNSNVRKKDKSFSGDDRDVPKSTQSSLAASAPKVLSSGQAVSESKDGVADVRSKAKSQMMEVAVVKHEVDEEDLEQQQALHAQWQTLSAQMSQALSMQALSAQMSQALSAAQMSEHLMSSHVTPRATLTQANMASSGQQLSPTTSNAAISSLSLQQLSQAHAYSLAANAAVGEEGGEDANHVDRMSAMAMWRSTCLPDPLPTPPFSLNVLRARDAGNTASARPRIIRETTQFFLAMKMWWTTQDYERIAELVLQHFPALRSVNIKKDLGTCARNMRRRLPLSRYKPTAYSKQWSSYQSPPHSLLKEPGVGGDGDSVTRGTGLTLGELATMASLREAVGQDKALAEATGIGALTDEQRQALLAHSMYEQSTLAWNALYQQQFSTPSSESIIPQVRSTKRSLSDTTAVKMAESLERDVLASAMKRNLSVEQSSRHYLEAEASRRHSVDMHAKDLKVEMAATIESDKKAGEVSKTSDMYLEVTEQSVAHTPLVKEQKRFSDSAAAVPTTLTAGMPESLAQAHQKPARAHLQSSVHIRQDPSCADEAPINLTCSTDVSKQQRHGEKDAVKSEAHSPKRSRSNSMETFSAREQVWFPHGSPWKKSGQTLFKALPSPLPVPKYSQKLLKAREEGLAYRHRSEVIRETARFFLGYKYWWSSADYSRISELVVSEFPDLKDPVTHPSQASFRRIQRDLSMCARNLRRKNTRRQKLSHSESMRSPRKAKGGTNRERKAGKEARTTEKQLIKSASSMHSSQALNMQSNSSAGKPETVTVSSSIASSQSLMQALVNSTVPSSLPEASDKGGAGMPPLELVSTSAVAAILTADSRGRPSRSSSEWDVHLSPSMNKSPAATHPSLASAISYIQTSSAPALSAQLSLAPSMTDSIQGYPSVQSTHSTVREHRAAGVFKEEELSAFKEEDSGAETALRSFKVPHETASRPGASSKTVRPKGAMSQGREKPVISSKQATPLLMPSADQGSGKVRSRDASGNSSKHSGSTEAEQHGLWLSGLGTSPHTSSSRQTLSNTTAIVTPTLSESTAHSIDSRPAESSVSHKVYIDPDHGSELQAQLTKLWQEGKFFDASLEVDGYRLPVHKLVLLAASPYLQSTFRHANPTSHLEVNLPRETAVGAARDFLKYVYQGVLHVAPDTVHALRRIAAMLQIDKLLAYCDDYLRLLSVDFSTYSLPDTLSHTISQVPRVSVNLRDAGHSSQRSYSTDDGLSLGQPDHTNMPHVASLTDSQHSKGLGTTSGRHASARKRRASATITDQASPTHSLSGKRSHSNVDVERHRDILSTHHSHRQAEEHAQHNPVHVSKHIRLVHHTASNDYAGSSHTSDEDHARLSHYAHMDDQSSSGSMLDSQTELVFETGDYQQFQLMNSHLSAGEHQEQVYAQHSHHAGMQSTGGVHSSSVIQRGPNMASHTAHLSMSGKEEDGLGEHEVAVQFLTAEHVQLEGDVLVQTQLDDDMVALLPHDDESGEGRLVVQDGVLDREVLAVATLETLACEGGDVVEEVVVGAGDLLQDVEVAACETVECSLLPQTYCSSPEASCSPSGSAAHSPSLPSMAGEWAPQHYRTHYTGDGPVPQLVLQEGLYSHASSQSATSVNVTDVGHQQTEHYDDQQDEYQQHCPPPAYITAHPPTDNVANASLTDTNKADSSSQGSLLPQTYCSSPERASPANN